MKWRIRDLVDLEYFLHRDAEAQSTDNRQDLHARDRKIFLESVANSAGEDAAPDRQVLLRAWLNRMRQEEKAGSAVLPGEGVESLLGSLRFLFLVVGLLFGGVSGASYLTYTGDSPVNVFVYLSVFVLVQLLLLGLLLILLLLKLSRKSLPVSSPLYTMIGRFVLRMLLAARNRAVRNVSADRRLQAESILGMLKAKTRTYGSLLFLPVFILTQLFAIGFNVGLLGATLFKVVTADIAFGWQSTLQLSPAAVHDLVAKIALPWSWLVQGDAAFPSLTQIEGSRIILKEGIYNLSSPDLASWWPFLCFAVLVYGLLPRLLLLFGAVALQSRCLARLDFRQAAYERLFLRMRTPQVSTRGRAVSGAGEAESRSGATAGEAVSVREGGSAAGNLLVMIPDEIYDSCRPGEIEAVVHSGGNSITDIVRVNQGYEADREVLAALRRRQDREAADILIVQEAWQPPILEYLDFIRQVRAAVGPAACIRIGLIGKPGPETVFTPVTEANRTIWVRALNAMGDPCLFGEELVSHAA